MLGTILKQRYQIIQQLGSGGFCHTYLAEDLDLPIDPKPLCVVKQLQTATINPDVIRLFEQEAKTLYKLAENHPQIPKLYSCFQEHNQFFIVQQYITGKDLSQEIMAGQQLGEDYVIRLLQETLEILEYVHKNKVIHRDIKPQNMMRNQEGELVLIDFGIVKQINSTIAIKTGTINNTIVIGTPGYMPSEQGMGRPKLSSDIYALGITAIQGLTGKLPQELEEDQEGEIIWRNHVNVSDKLGEFLTKMVRYDWRERYADAATTLQELYHNFPHLLKPKNQRSPHFTTIQNATKSNLISVQLNGKFGLISQGKLINFPQFEQIEPFGSEGLAKVKMGWKWGFINTTGQIVIPCQFDEVDDFYQGIARVKMGWKWGFINTTGDIISNYQFEQVENFMKQGLAKVKLDKKWGCINLTGQIVTPCEFETIGNFAEIGLAKVKKDGKWGYINSSGSVVIPCQFDDYAGSFYEGLARVKVNGKWGYINPTGQIVIPCQFENEGGNFSEGLAKVKKDGKWGYINNHGQIVIPFQFHWAEDFQAGLAKVHNHNRDHLIDKYGNIIY